MMGKGPSVSVVIPTYNSGSYLREAVESAFAQTLPPRELLVVDDASTDGTPDLVTALARQAPVPMRLIQLPHNSGGPAGPMNRGITEASGEFIAVLDHDDVFTPTKLEVQSRLLAERADLSVVFGLSASYSHPDQLMQSAEMVRDWSRFPKEDGDYHRLPSEQALRLLIQYGNCANGYPGFLFRREDWERKGTLDASFRIGSDYEFVCWLASQGTVGFVPHISYLCRKHGQNLCTRNLLASHHEWVAIKLRYLAQLSPASVDADLRRIVREQLFVLAYHLRNAGSYQAALRYHWLSLQRCGWDRQTLFALAKLLPHWLRVKCRVG